MRWVLFNEPFDSDSSELFSSIFWFSIVYKIITSRNNCIPSEKGDNLHGTIIEGYKNQNYLVGKLIQLYYRMGRPNKKQQVPSS